MTKTYYFVEDLNPAASYPDGTVVPLNPYPLFELGRRGIPYKIMEEFYSERELRSREAEFFEEEVAWIDRWDSFLNKRIEFTAEHELKLARMYYNRLKFFVNALIIQSWVLGEMAKKIGPGGKIVYIKKKLEKQARQNMHDFKYDEASLCFEALLPLVCKKYGLSYQFEYFQEPHEHENEPGAPNKPDLLKRITKKAAQLVLKLNRQSHSGLNVFFVHSGSGFLDPAIESLTQRGARVFTLRGKTVFKTSTFLESKVFHLSRKVDDSIQQKINQDCASAAKDLKTSAEGEDLIAWISRQCGFDIAEFVTPYLKSFVAETCPELLANARALAAFYKENSIQYVFSHTNADHSSKSALLAAQIHGGVKTAGLQHCWDPFTDRVMHLTENDAFDFYFTMDAMSERKYGAYNAEEYVRPAKIFQSPHYLNLVKSKAPKSRTVSKPYRRVLYVPTKLAAVHTRCFNCMVYPITWYLEFQKDLLAYFASRPEIQFIYKQPMIRAKFVKESVIPYLSEKNYPNIKIETKPVIDCFADVDAVIMDRPTTAFSEALMSGLPVLALYPDFVANMYDPESFRLFGQSFQSFKDSQEAAQNVASFLAGDPKLYSPKLEMTESDIAQILMSQEKPAHSRGPARKPAAVGSL